MICHAFSVCKQSQESIFFPIKIKKIKIKNKKRILCSKSKKNLKHKSWSLEVCVLGGKLGVMFFDLNLKQTESGGSDSDANLDSDRPSSSRKRSVSSFFLVCLNV